MKTVKVNGVVIDAMEHDGALWVRASDAAAVMSAEAIIEHLARQPFEAVAASSVSGLTAQELRLLVKQRRCELIMHGEELRLHDGRCVLSRALPEHSAKMFTRCNEPCEPTKDIVGAWLANQVDEAGKPFGGGGYKHVIAGIRAPRWPVSFTWDAWLKTS